MTDYFITSQFVLDLSRIAISYQEVRAISRGEPAI